MADISFDDIPSASQVPAITFDDIPTKAGIIQTIADQGAQGATFGLGDEIGAGFLGAAKFAGDRALLGADKINQALGNKSWIPPEKQVQVNQSLGEDYNNQLAETRQNLQNETQQRPILSMGSNLVGAAVPIVLSGGTSGGAALPNWLRTGNLLTRSAKGAAVGAASAGLYGYGAGEGDADNRINSAEQNLSTGAIVGGALPGAGYALKGAGDVIGAGARRIGAILGNEGAQSTIANNILAKRLVSEGYTPDEVAQAVADGQSSGLNPTLGEATGSSGVLQTEKTIMRGTGQGANQLRDALTNRNTDTIPNTLQGFADKITSPASDVSELYKNAANEAGDAPLASQTLDNISNSIKSRLNKLGSVNNVETKALNQAQNIIDTAKANGGDFSALHDAQKQLSNIYIDGADSGIQASANSHTAAYRSQIAKVLQQSAPYNFTAANQASMANMAANDLTDALNNSNEGSLAMLYNKVWAKPALREDFLRKLPDDATRAQATNLFTQLGNIKGGFGGSDTAFNLPANQLLAREAGLGFNPEYANPFESAPTILNKLGSFAQPGVYNQIAKQSLNTDTAPLLKAMQKVGPANVSPLLVAPTAEGAAAIDSTIKKIPSTPAMLGTGAAGIATLATPSPADASSSAPNPLSTRPLASAAIPAPAPDTLPPGKNMPRGIRNNNPGNLEGDQGFQGFKGTDSGGYATFETAEAGLRAMAINLRNQQDLHGLNTVQGIIGKYAPVTDNNPTAQYIAKVSKALGVQPNDSINLHDPAVLSTMMNAIVKQENGYNPYEPGKIATAAGSALFRAKAPEPDFMNAQLQKYNGNQALALMAYKWGANNVDLWLKSGAKLERIPAETKTYLKQMLG